jgi:cytochrome P450
METAEVFALVAAMLFFLAVLRRSTSLVVQVVRDPAVAHSLLNETADASTNRPNGSLLTALATFTGGPERYEGISTAAYGSHWRSLRSNLTAGFLTPSRMAAIAPLQRDAVQDLVAGLSSGVGEVDMREHLERAMFALAARMCFGDGVKESCVRALQRVMADLTQAMEDTVSFDGSTLGKITHWRRLRRLLGLFVPLGELVRPLIAASRSRARERETAGGSRHAYVDSLVDLRVPNDVDGGKRALVDNEILNLVNEFLATNSGVIVVCIEWTLANLVIHTEVQKKLRREIDEAAAAAPGAGEAEVGLSEKGLSGMPYLRAVVLESLRRHPPSPFVTRGVHDGGATGRLRKRLIFMVRDIGRHGSAWTDPDQFRPERFLPGGEAEDISQIPGRNEVRMMPFGGGRRFCPGANLAQLQAKFFLAALVRHFELAPPSCGVDLTETGEFNNLMKKPLRVRLTRRTLP